MNEQEKQAWFQAYNARTHVLGRVISVITLVLLVGAPFVIGIYLGAMPDLGAVARGFFSASHTKPAMAAPDTTTTTRGSQSPSKENTPFPDTKPPM